MSQVVEIAELDQTRLAESRAARIAEYKKRKQLYDFQTVPAAIVEEEKSKGWEFDRTLKSGIKLRRPKQHDEILENRFWSILYLLGFEKLNIGRNFYITVTGADGKKSSQQIDVLAADTDTVIVAECKSAEKPTKKSMEGALSKLDSNKRNIADAIKKLLGPNSNRKIIWCMVTANIRWSDWSAPQGWSTGFVSPAVST
ncbi:MAG: hypothetical protein R3B94_10885 [Hyphomonas sp.]